MRSRILWIVSGLLLIVLCMRQIREPDLWWQIRTGEYILEHKEVPQVDVFSFTFDGLPWVNVKWGSEILQAMVVKSLGVEWIPILQMIFSGLTFWVVYLMYKLFRKEGTSVAFLWASFLGVIILSFRMNSRPEMVSHLFSVVFIYLFLRWRQKRDGLVFLIVPLQLLWANMHEGYGMGIVLGFIFLVSFLVEKWYFKRLAISVKELRMYVLALALAWLGVAVHPMGTKMWTYFLNIFNQLGENQFTTELYGWSMKEYWNWISLLSLSLAAYLGWYLYKRKKNLEWLEPWGLGYVLVLLAFFYLSLSSHRNIPFFILVSIPLLAGIVDRRIGNQVKSYQWSFLVVGGVFYLMVVSNVFYDLALPRERYGLKVNPFKNSVGVCNYIKKHQIKGDSFTDYITSSYMLWALQPDYKTFIDLRDLDVFNAPFMSTAMACLAQPRMKTPSGEEVWHFLDDRAKYDYVVLGTNPQFNPLHQTLLQDGRHVLAYEDNLSRLYIRKGGANDALLTDDFEKFGNLRYLEAFPKNTSAQLFSKIFWPPFK